MTKIKLTKKLVVALIVVILTFSNISLIPNKVLAATNNSNNNLATINYATEIGDSNASGDVNIIDLIHLKKHLSGEGTIDEILSDIKCDGIVNSYDLVSMRKLLLGIDISDIAYPRIEKTKYVTTEVIVADTNVKLFGAKGDGVTDDTQAFVTAINSLGESGGVVYVPSGRYKLINGFVIPPNVTLQGDFADPQIYDVLETKNGSRLELYSNTVAQGNKTAFFRMRKFTGLRGFMIWYPNQQLNDGAPIEYPYTIDLVDWQSTNLRDLYIVNSYNAINDMANTHNLETIQNIYMTSLNVGIETQYNNDIGRFENINIGPEWWLNSGLTKNLPKEKLLKGWTQNNTEGFKIYSIDNIYASDITVNDCKTAIYIKGGYGKFYNVNINGCDTGIDINGGTTYGYTFTNGEINAKKIAVETALESDCQLSFYNIDMSSQGVNVLKNSSSSGMTLTMCDISLDSDTGEYAINCESGYVSAVECNIQNTNPDAYCAYISSSVEKSCFVNCNTAETFNYIAESEENILIDFNSDSLVNVDSEINGYERQIKKPQRQAIYNVLDYGIDTTETKDVSDILQHVIDIAADAGGGIVYLPSYDYLLQKPITVKSGVELRGSADRPHFGEAINTTFVTDYGRNDESGIALINLESNSGLRGITVDYSETRPDGTPYAFTIRGNGENIYVVNCTVDAAWQVIDFATNKCDYHYIEAVNFGTLKTGIVVGGGSVGGIVRDCQSNPTSNRDNRNTVRDEWFSDDGKTCLSTAWCLKNVKGYIIEDVINELHFMNFIYGCATGLEISGNSTVTAVGHGTDQADYGIYISDSSQVDIIATELPVNSSKKSYGVYLEDGYTGEANVVNTEIWAVGESAYYCGGGTLNIHGSILSTNINCAVQVVSGKTLLTSSVIRGVRNNYKVQKYAVGLEIYGNITRSNNNGVLHKSSSIKGSDVELLVFSTVSTDSVNTVDFWNDTLVKYSNFYSDYDYKINNGSYGSDSEGGFLYCTLDNNTNPIISFQKKTGFNATDMRYLEFDLYIPDVSFFDKCTNNMQLEISSSTKNDTNEICYGISCLKNGMLKSGWNHIKLDLERYDTKVGEIDFSDIKRIRMYFGMSETISGQLRVKNFKFSPSDYPENVVYFNDYSSKSGWGSGLTNVSCHSGNDAYYCKGSPITYVRNGVDINDMDYFSFDIYISDVDLFNNATGGQIELTSSKYWDKAEAYYNYTYYFKDMLSAGWNKVTIPISAFSLASTTTDVFDPSNVNFFRIYINNSQLGIGVGNLVFGNY